MNQPETTRKKARSIALSLGHDLVNFRKSKTHASVAYCKHCFKYVFVDKDECRGHAVTDPCLHKPSRN